MADEATAPRRTHPVHHGTAALAEAHRAKVEELAQPVAQQCTSCRHLQSPPRLRCSRCHSDDLGWVGCGTEGVVATWVTVHGGADTPSMSVPGRLAARMPYSTVFLEPVATPGIRVAALYFPAGHAASDLAVGARMTVALEGIGGRQLPVCAPAGV